jgi:hypothetical protein
MRETRSVKAPWVFVLVSMLMMLSVNRARGLLRDLSGNAALFLDDASRASRTIIADPLFA